LNIDGASHGADDARKFHQHAVAGEFHDAPVVFRDFRVGQIFPDCSQSSQRPGFISAHEAAVASHIGGKNSCQAAFHLTSITRLPKGEIIVILLYTTSDDETKGSGISGFQLSAFRG
jgi:hypothetical protein